MPLPSDTVFGVYEVLGPLGAGGMGEVYRARDRRLGREVAIKVLPEQLAGRPEHMDWLVREARLLASLSHPNIAVVYGLEETSGVRALVMELVPGETLAQRLARGPLSAREALSVCRQAAAALECAHRQGIVHRDLKPSNLMLVPDGTVKVLDFGLARVFAPAATAPSMSKSPTLASDRTHPGTIVGTISYMSPEQARGHAVDRQSDIWALGCVLYEALTAKLAFGGDTPADAFASILDREPDWEALPSDCPPRVRELLGRCLSKRKEERLRDIGDARTEIEAIVDSMSRPPAPASSPAAAAQLTTQVSAPAATTGRPHLGGRRAGLVAAAIGVLVVAGGGVSWFASHRPARAVLPKEKVLVVLPFRDLGPGSEGTRIGEGLAENLAARIARQGDIQIVAAPLSPGEPDLAQMVRQLGVNLAIRGSVQRQEAVARITFSLLELPGGAVLASDTFSGPASDLFALEDRVVGRSLAFLQPGAKAVDMARPIAAGEGQDRYFEALGLLRRSDDDKSVSEAVRLLEAIPAGERSALVQAALTRAFLYRYRLTRDRSWADRALEASNRASTLDAGLPEVPLAAGEILLGTGQPERAERSFRAALALRPAYVEALQGLARTLEQLGKDVDAEAVHKKVIALRPSWPRGWIQLGIFEFRFGSFAEAEAAFRKAASLDPDDARTAYRLAAVLYERGHLEEARSAAARSIALDPTPQALSNNGTVLYALGRFGEAAQMFERAAALLPGNGTIWINLGDARRNAKETAGAADAYRKAASAAEQEAAVNPKDDQAQLSLALAAARLGDAAGARRRLEKVRQLAPNDPEALFQAAILQTAWGDRVAALSLLERAVDAGKNPVTIGHEPDLADLKDDPRFRALDVRRKGKGGSP
jgi:Flp pilus assembly protein TadD/TolB-like protein